MAPLTKHLTRRRILKLFAASTTLAAAPVAAKQESLHHWRGIALGADAQMTLCCENAAAAARLFAMAEKEVARLEAIFSLYRSDSALSMLNRNGELSNPPLELLEVLSLSGAVHRATSGAFDPTVQSLWEYHAEVAAGASEEISARLKTLIAQSGWRHIAFDSSAVALLAPETKLTLNGVAQGYISDRVAGLMRANGMTNILIDLGEISACGRRDGVARWRVGIAGEGDEPVEEVTLEDMAIATSAPLGTTLDQAGRLGHIIDPRTGSPAASHWRQVSVIYESAAIADALSTGAIMLDRAQLGGMRAEFPSARLIAFDTGGGRFAI